MKSRTHRIGGNTYDEERALYNLTDTEVTNCTFSGPADGESAFKEAKYISVSDCKFSLRYPFWHTKEFEVLGCEMDNLTRAPLWYSENGIIANCSINGVKCLRECRDIVLDNCNIVSPEFGWRCKNVDMNDCDVESEYFLFECRGGKIERLHLKGKYSFQYTYDLTVENSLLETKDAFWHAENVVVRNCTITGAYFGWYSHGLTLENCHISGTQPFCYCEDLKLINCTMEGTDLSFECSSVNADVKGEILSVKNPKSGCITADSICEIIRDGTIFESSCEITVR